MKVYKIKNKITGGFFAKRGENLNSDRAKTWSRIGDVKLVLLSRIRSTWRNFKIENYEVQEVEITENVLNTVSASDTIESCERKRKEREEQRRNFYEKTERERRRREFLKLKQEFES